MGPGSRWEGLWGREHLQTSTRLFAGGLDQLQLNVMCQLLRDMFCSCCMRQQQPSGSRAVLEHLQAACLAETLEGAPDFTCACTIKQPAASGCMAARCERQVWNASLCTSRGAHLKLNPETAVPEGIRH